MLRSSHEPLEGSLAAKLGSVYAITRILTAALDEDAVIVRACELLAERWPFAFVAFARADGERPFRLSACAGPLRDVLEGADGAPAWLARGSPVGALLREPSAVSIQVAALGDAGAVFAQRGVRAIAAVPIEIDDRRAAFILFSNEAPAFAPAELQLLQSLGEDVARTVEGLRLRGELFEERRLAATRLERLEALWEITSRDLDVDVAADEIVREGAARLGFEGGAIGRVVGDNIIYDVATSNDRFYLLGETLSAEQTLSGLAVREGRTLFSRDLQSDRRYESAAVSRSREARSIVACPFTVSGRQHVLAFVSSNPRAELDDEDVAYVELLASHFGRMLQHRDDAAQISFLQNHDPLTNLPNRFSFTNRLREAVERSSRMLDQMAVLLIDVVGLRQIIDDHGQAMADRVMAELGARLTLRVSADDLIFRYGSEGFSLIHTRWRSVPHIDDLAHEIITTLEAPITIADVTCAVAACVGLAIYPDDGASGDDLEIAAETALRRAKREGTSGHRFYSSELDAHLAHRRMAALELRRAIDAGALVLHYQPIVKLSDTSLIALEALVRWPHPDRGMLMPGHFVPLAEESDLILHLGGYVLREAAMAAHWFSERELAVPIAVNISAAQFAEPAFVHGIRNSIRAAGIDPTLIELELTESVAMHDPRRTESLMQQCREMGLRIALDDFGTGHSSLAVLKRLPIDILKLDKSFVNGLPDDVEDAAIARAVLALGKSLGCEVRAEGVETQAQAQWLRAEGCDSAQGYLYARPADRESVARAGREG